MTGHQQAMVGILCPKKRVVQAQRQRAWATGIGSNAKIAAIAAPLQAIGPPVQSTVWRRRDRAGIRARRRDFATCAGFEANRLVKHMQQLWRRKANFTPGDAGIAIGIDSTSCSSCMRATGPATCPIVVAVASGCWRMSR